MAKLLSTGGLLSVRPQKRFSKQSGYGLAISGFSIYGDEAVGIAWDPIGGMIFGKSVFGDYLLLSGIYQIRKCDEGRIPTRTDFYNYGITHTAGQQARREKFDLAVAAWQGLTTAQKEVYRHRAIGKRMSGYNLFLSEYMLS